LGVDDWQEGSNKGKQIDTVYDVKGQKMDAPKFQKAYAGAGVPSDSGEMHSMLIDENGNVYTSGRNSKGQLCLGDNEDRTEFSQVGGLPKPAIAGTIGFEFTFILLEDGTVWGCGSNEFGELGLGPKVDFTNKPDKGNGLNGIIDLASGYKFTVFLDSDNVVYGTGGNIYGQQCFFTEGEPATVPTAEILDSISGTVVQVAANRESSYFLFTDGTAVACGRNDEGQLGDGTFVNTSEGNPIVNVNLKEQILEIGTGPSAQSVFFITENSVYGAGLNDRFQLGINEIGSQEFPVKVDFDGDVAIYVISASGTHSLAAGNYL
jgi:alpha-tubulin suppressor-like RCC1 family protein